MARRRGFTLIELMLVVGIIAILITLAVPAVLRHRQNANETAAITSLRAISTGQAQFKAANIVDGDGDGESDYGTLAQLSAPPAGNAEPFIDSVLGSGAKQGYVFRVNVVNGNAGTTASFEAFADPAVPGSTGVRRFYVDASGVIRVTNDGSAPGPNSPGLG